jgi:hypothetical protein
MLIRLDNVIFSFAVEKFDKKIIIFFFHKNISITNLNFIRLDYNLIYMYKIFC